MIYASGFDFEICQQNDGKWIVGLRGGESFLFKTLDEVQAFAEGLSAAARFQDATGMKLVISPSGTLFRYLRDEAEKALRK